MNDAEKLQEKYMQHQMLEQQLKQMQEQLVKFESQIAEISSIAQSISDVEDVKEGTEILVPVANGIFIKAEMKNNDALLVNVGKGVTVKKGFKDTRDLLQSQADEISRFREQLISQIGLGVNKLNQIQAELKKMIQE